MLGAEAGQSIAVFDHDRGHRRIAQQRVELGAVSVEGGAGFGDGGTQDDAALGALGGDPARLAL
ncbi:hypothetical protein GCM10022402_33910 [Salinactinospora qingdaonensis]|uniref:Uncharacterized protein n=1 Tax=Salinactinospora qingdaonensis TaxID=702744 RepID=A0ABP7G180_9ACTN